MESYVEEVVLSVLVSHSEDYYQLELSTRRCHNLIAKMKERSINWTKEILMAQQGSFIHGVLHDNDKPSVEVEALTGHPDVLPQAYDLKMRTWTVSNLVNKEIEIDIVIELVGPCCGSIERLLEESPAIAGKHDKVSKTIKKLEDSQEILANIMNGISL
ncbi:hypothetical protein Prudu_872S000400, partial [Prunus dulcis]